MNVQFWALPADGARVAASRILVSTSSGTGSALNRRSARAENIASNRPMSFISPSLSSAVLDTTVARTSVSRPNHPLNRAQYGCNSQESSREYCLTDGVQILIFTADYVGGRPGMLKWHEKFSGLTTSRFSSAHS